MNPDISGYWHGVLDTGTFKAKLIFNIEPEGSKVWLRTRTQGDIALALVRTGDRLSLETRAFDEARAIDVALDLRFDADADRLEGGCRHAGIVFPVRFARGLPSDAAKAARPQTPTAPFPYQTRTVSFEGADGSRLEGTLTMPHTGAPHAAAVLSSWFGRTDRDQTTAGHKPFAIWADALTRRGLATLRFDKRGVGASAGDFDQTTTADSAADLARAAAFLRDQSGIDPAGVGVIGHSEGGHISADAAAADPSIAFCVLMTPSGVAEEETYETELFRAAIAVGATPLRLDLKLRLAHTLSEIGRTAPSAEEASAQTWAFLTREAAAGNFPADRIELYAAVAASPWRRYWARHDHTRSLRALTCPTLAVFAERDLQTAPRCHAPNVRAALAGNALARIVELPGLNHFLQTARTGAPSEYGDIEQTLAPEAIKTVCDWVANVAAARGSHED